MDSPSCGLGEYRLTTLAVGVNDRAVLAVTLEPVNPSSPSLGPDPLAFWNSVVPRSSYTQISDPRSIALPIAGLLLFGS